MFMKIDTNGASTILVSVPSETASTNLSQLIRLFEDNATFVREGYREIQKVNPVITVTLGDEYRVKNYDEELVMAVTGKLESVLDESFVPYTNEAYVSNKEVRDKADKEAETLRAEIKYLKAKIENLQESLKELSKEDE